LGYIDTILEYLDDIILKKWIPVNLYQYHNPLIIMLFYKRIKQAKFTDIYDTRLNSIDINPTFFRNYLKKWRKKNML